MQRETLCSFRHDYSKRGSSTLSSSPTPKSQTKNDGINSSKGRPALGTVHPGKGSRSFAEVTSKALARIHRVIFGILSCARIIDHRQAASMARSVRSYTRRWTDSQRKQERVEEKDQSPWIKIWKQLGMCISRCVGAEDQIYFKESNQSTETKKGVFYLRHVLFDTQKFGTEIHDSRWFHLLFLMSAVPSLQKSRIESKKIPW